MRIDMLCAQEDELLLRLVQEDGLIRWCDISSHFPDRSGKQCSERFKMSMYLYSVTISVSDADEINGRKKIGAIRYRHYLCPRTVRDAWSGQEDLAILTAHKAIGNKWKEM
jgi:hypothetical protein